MFQAPFTTTPSRSDIDFSLEINKNLFNEVLSLLKDSLITLKSLGLFNTDVLELLPIRDDIDQSKLLYWKAFEIVKNELSSDKKLLPSISYRYEKASELALVRGKELSTLLPSSKDLSLLFGRKYWLSTDITIDRTPDLRKYLLEHLQIPEFTPIDFARRISKEFIETKSDAWLIRFYEFLNTDQEALWRSGYSFQEGPLRKKPIIRLEDGSHIAPFNETGEIQVFLPASRTHSKYNVVKPSLFNTRGSKEFLVKKLGIEEPDLLDEIKHHVLPLYHRSVQKYPKISEHLYHFEIFLDAYKSENYKKPLIDLLKNSDYNFIHVINSKTRETSFNNYMGTSKNSIQQKNSDISISYRPILLGFWSITLGNKDQITEM